MRETLRQIEELKKQKNAVIFAHYYAPSEVQQVADYVGDSYYLAKKAKGIDADVVVFCGVGFMGESVKILNPEKTVLMPDLSADCPMAHMASTDKIKKLREEVEDLAVVCYINSSASLKAMSDVCVTSSNAVSIVKRLKNKNVYFIPDQNLGRFVKEQVPEKNVILNDGCCPVHAAVTILDLERAKEKYPNALVLTHPECVQEVVNRSDFIGSTAEIIKFAKESNKKEFIICTEEGVGFNLSTDNPDKKFYFVTDTFCCKDMKLNTLENVLEVLKTGKNEIRIDLDLAEKAVLPLDKMLELAN